MKLTMTQLENLDLIEQGYKAWRRGFVSLERKGLVTRLTYANGDFAELTDAGRAALTQEPNQPESGAGK